MPEKKTIEKYKVKVDDIETDILITGGMGSILKYEVQVFRFTPATSALIEDVRDELIIEVQVTSKEILDPKVIDELKKKFKEKADIILTAKIPTIGSATKSILIGELIRKMLGLGDIEFILNDAWIEEIVINTSSEPLRIYHKKYGWMETNLYVKDESQINNYANIIARRVGRQITTLNPLLDAQLITGDRANAILYPISTKGNTITIRKFARDPWTVTDFVKNKTASSYIMALIWIATQYELNVLISGGTASGKTSFLNICMPFIPPNQRIVSIEDTRELQLPSFLYWCPMVTRLPNPEGKGEIRMLDLLVNSLRMRPDRIVLGEIRRKIDAEVLFEAMHTGHAIFGTVHANSIQETLQRLINPPIEVAENLLQAVDLNAVMFRDRRTGIRKLFQLGEFVGNEESGKAHVSANLLFRYKPTTDSFIQHNVPIKLFEELSRHTGLSQSEIEKDIKNKEMILNWLVKHDIRDVESVGKIMKEYYVDSNFVTKVASKNENPDKVLKL
ncbi:MAG TPA: ATPase, T2SS/T4P/T4SS family [Candidatus Nanoarchaeia archaeon]|nr:ATPase, T2SS/T4P/T4SS family [Candidatus Nanoarchaeia archaeon]